MTKAEEVVLARMVKMRLNIDGFEEATLKTLEKNYKAAIKALLADLKKAKGKPGRIWTNTRLIKVFEETQLQHRAIVEALSNSVAGSVADVGVYSYSEMNNIVGWDGLVEGFNDVRVPRARLLQLTKVTKIGGKDLAEWVGSALEPDLEAIKAQIATGVIRGEGYDKMVRAIKDELGLVKGSKKARDMETVVKSYIQSMNVAAQEDLYAANEEILDEIEWSAIMENGNFATGRGTCPRCMALDGQRWGLNEARPDCPLHARCRCLLYPVTKSWDDLLPGRGLADLEEPKYKTPWNIRNLDTKQRQIIERGKQHGDYEIFWKSQGKSFQNNAIGPKRAAMIRNGMPFKSIIDKDGNLIPIRGLPDIYKPKPIKPKPPRKKPVTQVLPSGDTGLKKEHKTGFGMDLKDSKSRKFASGVDESLQADYQDYFFSTDPFLETKSKGRGKKPSFYSVQKRSIQMAMSKAGQTRSGTTYIHEFGHRTDHKYGRFMHQKWGSSKVEQPGGQFVSTTERYHKAMLADESHMDSIGERSLKALGGKGVTVGEYRVGLSRAINKAHAKFREKYPNVDLETLAKIKKLPIKPEHKYLSDLVDDLVSGYKKNSKGAFYDKYALKAELAMRKALVMAEQTKADAFILTDYLDNGTMFLTNDNGVGSWLYLQDVVEATSLTKYGRGHGIAYLRKGGGWGRNLESFGNIFALSGNPKYKKFFNDFMPNQSNQFDNFIDEIKEFDKDD